MPQWNVGLLFTKKKIERSGFIGIEYYARQHDINVILLDISHPIESQGSVDVIVHKMTDVVGKMNRGDAQARIDYNRFMTYCRDHPNVIILDQWEHVEKVLDRVDLFHHLTPCVDRKDPLFKIPPYYPLDSIKSITQLTSDVSFPVICKRRSACSSTEAHRMTLIPSRQHLTNMNNYDDSEALVVQKFIQHDGVIIKVYVIDRQIYVSTRPSFMNLTKETDMVYFDSQKLPKQFGATIETDLRHYISDTMVKQDILNHEKLRQIGASLQGQLGLTFFGFDVLLETGTNDYYIVDVNYFPSFKNVPHFQSMFISILQKKLSAVQHAPSTLTTI